MKNQQLNFDLNNLLQYDDYCFTDITTDYDEKLGYILDIKDNSYFYDNEQDRDSDDNEFMGKIIDNGFYL